MRLGLTHILTILFTFIPIRLIAFLFSILVFIQPPLQCIWGWLFDSNMEDDVENNSGADNDQSQILANNKEKSFSNEHEMQHRHHHHRYRHRYHIHIWTLMPPLWHLSMHSVTIQFSYLVNSQFKHRNLIKACRSCSSSSSSILSFRILSPVNRQPLAHVYNISVDQHR